MWHAISSSTFALSLCSRSSGGGGVNQRMRRRGPLPVVMSNAVIDGVSGGPRTAGYSTRVRHTMRLFKLTSNYNFDATAPFTVVAVAHK